MYWKKIKFLQNILIKEKIVKNDVFKKLSLKTLLYLFKFIYTGWFISNNVWVKKHLIETIFDIYSFKNRIKLR